ncbi:hypothetical protein Vadar_021926 [Vaccinium darrowii]|uniref:Uncharacterized protein n=1 Tax=Vaccinium darrowii TaxID=229202 RepID=A0ACB7XSY3_9ERIC|nr:hypothetical protein Vadar_021926 [Vaccinium darrowii]
MATIGFESPSPSAKFACIFVKKLIGLESEWYAFDVSDDPQHNQSPPFPPPPRPRFLRHAKHLLFPFHEDDESRAFTLEPKATAKFDNERCWAILGGSNHTLYRIRDSSGKDGSRDPRKPNLVERVDLIGGGSKWESAATMPNRIYSAHRCLVLNGKLYCLGGYRPSFINDDGVDFSERKRKWSEEKAAPWAMAYDPTSDVWESLPDPPVVPEDDYATFSAVVDFVNDKPRIVLGSPLKNMLQIYDVDTRDWEQQDFVIGYNRIQDLVHQAAPLAVDNKLYWYAVDIHCLVGYDLDTKMWFQGYLPMHDHDAYVYSDHGAFPPCLGHLGGGDNFCLLWVSLLTPRSPGVPELADCNSRIHCMKFRVTTIGKPSLDGASIPLEISVLSCQSYLVSGPRKFMDGLVV